VFALARSASEEHPGAHSKRAVRIALDYRRLPEPVSEANELNERNPAGGDEMRRSGDNDGSTTGAERALPWRQGAHFMQSTKSKNGSTLTVISTTTPEIVTGLDGGDRKSHYCRLDKEGVVAPKARS
jgi:hypothetical protein